MASDRRKGAPECIKDGEWQSKPKKNKVKPPEINALCHRTDNAGVKRGSSPVDKEGNESVEKGGNAVVKGGDGTPEVDPEMHGTGAPQESELTLSSFNPLSNKIEEEELGIWILSCSDLLGQE